jgi:hypothetical protein
MFTEYLHSDFKLWTFQMEGIIFVTRSKINSLFFMILISSGKIRPDPRNSSDPNLTGPGSERPETWDDLRSDNLKFDLRTRPNPNPKDLKPEMTRDQMTQSEPEQLKNRDDPRLNNPKPDPTRLMLHICI